MRRRSYARNPRVRVRRYRRNPGGLSVAGFNLPAMDAVLFTGAGFIVPPLVQSFAMRFIPVAYQSNQAVMWLVRAASAVVPPMLVKKFVSQRAGNLMLLGGMVSLAIDAVKTFAPGMIPGLGSQPFLGAYIRPRPAGMGRYFANDQRRALAGPGNGNGNMNSIWGGVPERLQASARF